MRRLGYLLAGLVMATSLMGTVAAAGVEWCAEDPIIDVLGTRFDLTTEIGTAASSVSRISYVIVLPSNAGPHRVSFPPGDVLAAITDVTVLKTGEPLERGEREFHVRATVTVTAPDGTQVILTSGGRSAERAAANGWANRPVRLDFEVRRGK